MDPGLLIAQVTHGPGGGMVVVHLALVAILLVGGVAFLVLRGRRAHDRHGAGVPDRAHQSDRGPEA